MIRWNFIRGIVVLLLMAGIVSMPGFGHSPHIHGQSDVAEATRHGTLKSIEITDHGHSHDDGEDHEQLAGHEHGHDPADHFHQDVLISHTAFDEIHMGCDTPQARVPDLIKLETYFGIDRPPKAAQRA